MVWSRSLQLREGGYWLLEGAAIPTPDTRTGEQYRLADTRTD